MRTDDRAGFWVRLAAFAIDRLLLAVILLLVVRLPMLFASAGNGMLSGPIFFSFTATDILCWLVISAYFVVLTARGGATLGKRAMRLRVVSVHSGLRPSFLTVLYRETVGRYLSGILYIGYILVVDDSKQCLHDRICDTLVVYSQAEPKTETPAKAPEWTPVPVEDPVKDWYKPYRT